jgi:hypothetical protein
MPDDIHTIIGNSLDRLHTWVLRDNYNGWDLFDGLNSRFLQCSPFYRFPLVRLAWIQAFKRSPVNLRAITGVPKGNNSKGLSLFAAGLILRNRPEEARPLIERLYAQAITRKAGQAWGYNFPWESRAFYVPVGTPNVVSTVFVANALLDYFDMTADQQAMDMARSAAEFILDELLLFEDDTSVCFGYIPGETARVHNASMMAAALMGRLYALTKTGIYYDKSRKAMAYATKALKPDFSWPYGERHHHQFVDNFHTGFNLVALHDWMQATGDREWLPELRGAYGYFIENFWLADGTPKYYNNSLYPIDTHSSAQGIVTCIKLGDMDDRSDALVQKIATWAISNMQSSKGYFYYQKKRYWKNRIPYIRWSQAWMFYALSMLLASQDKDKDKDKSISGHTGHDK